jgi:hypothetical protein
MCPACFASTGIKSWTRKRSMWSARLLSENGGCVRTRNWNFENVTGPAIFAGPVCFCREDSRIQRQPLASRRAWETACDSPMRNMESTSEESSTACPAIAEQFEQFLTRRALRPTVFETTWTD